MPKKPDIAQTVKPLPLKIHMEQDFIYWIKVHGAEITRQFYANQVITDLQAIAEIIERNGPIKDQA